MDPDVFTGGWPIRSNWGLKRTLVTGKEMIRYGDTLGTYIHILCYSCLYSNTYIGLRRKINRGWALLEVFCSSQLALQTGVLYTYLRDISRLALHVKGVHNMREDRGITYCLRDRTRYENSVDGTNTYVINDTDEVINALRLILVNIYVPAYLPRS